MMLMINIMIKVERRRRQKEERQKKMTMMKLMITPGDKEGRKIAKINPVTEGTPPHQGYKTNLGSNPHSLCD